MSQRASRGVQSRSAARRRVVAGRPGRFWSRLNWGYAAALLATALLLHIGGDRWWPATVLLFGPRWVFALPLVVVAGAAYPRLRAMACLGVCTFAVVFPLMGFHIPLSSDGATAPPLRVATCNVQGEHARLGALVDLITAENLDLALFQEFSRDADLQPLSAAGWHVRKTGGLGIASTFPIESVEYHISEHGTEAAYYRLRHATGTIDVCNVHLISPRSGLEAILSRRTLFRPSGLPLFRETIARRRRESTDAARWVQTFDDVAIVGGDFNTPPESRIFDGDWSRFRNAFAESGWGFGFTKYDSVGGLPFGVRIDHVLLAAGYSAAAARVGPDIGSDHRPLIADIFAGP